MPSLALACRLSAVSRRPFSPASLFTSGEQGAWYDPSDYSTMFEDAAGTIPITTPLEKPVGLMLDKSKGLVLGSELVTNGDFSNGTTGWSVFGGGSVTASNGQATLTGGLGSTLYQAVGITLNKRYRLSITVVSASTGLQLQFGGSNQATATITTPGTYSFDLSASVAGVNGNFAVVLQGGGSSTIDNISVREVTGNHCYQSTTTSRPTLSARYNLLTKTEQFDDAAWTKDGIKAFGSGSVANTSATTDPLGGNSADFIQENTSNAPHRIYQLFGSSTTGQRSIHIKSSGNNRWFFIEDSIASAWFNPDNGTLGTVSAGATATITNVGNGWYYCTLNSNAAGASNAIYGISNANNVKSYTGDGTSGIYIWGADLRVANDGIGLPAYQRVNTATDYDYAGFPPYLKFDGTDDSMATGNIDFSGTDKMSVFAGVRKLSDVNVAVFTELSTAPDSNNGTFATFAPSASSGNDYYFRFRGTSSSNASSAASFASPTTNVLTGLGNISGDSAILRINGAQSASSVTDQGTGNFGNYPLYIGRRGGSSSPFNGRLYSLIVCGKLASAAEIANTESYINNKTKAY